MQMYAKRRIANESGTIMLEGLMVFGITLLLLFLVLSIFSVLYQQWNIRTIANEAVTRVAQTYKFADSDVDTGEVSIDQLTSVRPYRYLWNSDELEDAARTKLKSYVTERLRKTTFAKQAADPEITVEVKHDALARRHIELTVKGSFSVPFGQILAYLGLVEGDGAITYQTTSYAECLDLSDYVSSVKFVGNALELDGLNSGVVSAIDSILNLATKILNL